MQGRQNNRAILASTFWARNPLVSPAIALCVGILLGRYILLNGLVAMVLAILLIAAASTVCIVRPRYFLVPILAAIAMLGLIWQNISSMPRSDSLPPGEVRGMLRGEVCEQPQVSQLHNSIRITLRNCAIKCKENGLAKTRKLGYKVLLFIKADPHNLWPTSSFVFDDSPSKAPTQQDSATVKPRRFLNYGDILEAPVRTSRLPPLRNPGGFNAREYYAQRGVMRRAYCSSEARVRITRNEQPGLFATAVKVLWEWRRRFRNLLERTCDADVAPMAKALILGDRTGIRGDHYDQLQRIGVAHIIAISGLHVGFVAFMFYFFFKRIFLFMQLFRSGTLGLRLTCIATMAPVLFYSLVVSPRHATVRATVIVVCFLIAKAIDRERLIFSILALAAIIILIWMPAALFEAGFQLSFVAAIATVVGLTYVFSKAPVWLNAAAVNLPAYTGQRLRTIGLELPFSRRASGTGRVHARGGSLLARLQKAVSRIAVLMLTTPVIGIFTAPFVAWWFGRISLIGPLANLYIVPVATALVPLLLLAFLVFPASQSLAAALLWAANWVAHLMNWLAGTFSSGSLLARSLVSTPAILAYAALAFFLLVLWALIKRPARKKLVAVAIASTIIFAAMVFTALKYGSWTVARPSLLTCISYYIALVLVWSLLYSRSRRRLVATAAAAALLFASVLLGARWPSGLLRVAFLDVGRGFSSVVESPGGKVAVIDGGGSAHGASDVGRNVLLPYLRHRGIDRIDYLILSNPHSERIDGLFSLLVEARSGALGSLEIGQVVFRDFHCTSRKYNKFRSAISQLGLPVTKIGNLTGLRLRSFAENSLVVKLEFGNFSILFLGDAGRISQTLLSEYGSALNSTILVVPEGYEASLRSSFMDLVSPRAIIVSGAAHRRRKARLLPLQSEVAERRVFRTSEMHCLIVESDGQSWRALTPFAERSE